MPTPPPPRHRSGRARSGSRRERAAAAACAAVAAFVNAACAVAPDAPGGDGRGAGPPGKTDGVGVCSGGLPAGRSWRRIESDGRAREYLVYVPTTPAAEEAPVLLSFHGLLSDPKSHAEYTGLAREANARGWIAVFPEGEAASWNAGACCGLAQWLGVDDVQFVRDVLADLDRVACIDRGRVYAAGASNGAFFASRLGCELADELSAVAAVSGTESVTCHPSRPISILRIHGTGDLTTPYDGHALHQPVGAETSFRRWGARNGCGGSPFVTYAVGEVRCSAYPTCADSVQTELCRVEGGGHQWPGSPGELFGGHTTQDLDATDYILDFFEEHGR